MAANLIRFDGDIPARYWDFVGQVLPAVVVIRLACFTAFGLYRGVWAYASIGDLLAIGKAATVGSVALWPARRSGARAVRVMGAGAAGERGARGLPG